MKLELFRLLNDSREDIIREWKEQLFNSYSTDGAKFFSSKSDKFSNPVGYAFSNGIEIIYTGLENDRIDDEVKKALDGIIRVRSIQDITPEESLKFIFDLKLILQQMIQKQQIKAPSNDVNLIHAKIDKLMLLGMNIYASCRDQLYEIRQREIKNKYYTVLKRSSLFSELPEDK